jgi:hypothetical protein
MFPRKAAIQEIKKTFFRQTINIKRKTKESGLER